MLLVGSTTCMPDWSKGEGPETKQHRILVLQVGGLVQGYELCLVKHLMLNLIRENRKKHLLYRLY